jgi:membrane dipeptidase
MNVWQHPELAARLDGQAIEVEGWIYPLRGPGASNYFALVAEAPCCFGCLPRDPAQRIEVFAAAPVAAAGAAVRLAGRWRCLADDAAGWRFQLHDARLLASTPAFTRRRLLAAGPLLCVAAAAPSAAAAARQAMADTVTIDMHSHAGALIGVWRVHDDAPFTPLAAPMRAGGMAVACLAIVPDAPALRSVADTRFEPFRLPEPGELHAYAQLAFARLHALARAEGLRIVADSAGLGAAESAAPSVIVAAEGGDFLEGDAERVDEAYERWRLRHLQLTHYRVNELGDIQTAAPVHGGLTATGAEVIRRCNRRGIVVDVAHGTYALVKQAAAVTTKPLVLSHTSLIPAPGPHNRRISPDHARAVAHTGGVIGVWPPAHLFPTIAALAAGIARMVDVVGVDHVGIGTDMDGLIAGSCLPSYESLPALAAALLDTGFRAGEIRKLLGGNYLRVFAASLG